MLFYFDANGYPLKTVPEMVFQGSNKANTIYFAMPITSSAIVTASFLLPTGEVLAEQQMTPYGAVTQRFGRAQLQQWSIDLTTAITAFPGQCTVQFKATNGDVIIATAAAEFTVSKGVPIRLPDLSALDKDTYQKLIETISSLQNVVIDANSSAGFLFEKNASPQDPLTSTCYDFVGDPRGEVLRVAPYSIDNSSGGYCKVMCYGNGTEAVVETVKVRLPDTLEEIAAYAFNGAEASERPLEIPASVQSVGENAFNINVPSNKTQNISFEMFPNYLHERAFGQKEQSGGIIVFCPPAAFDRWQSYKTLYYPDSERLIIRSDDLTDYYTKEQTDAVIDKKIQERAYIKNFTKDDFVKVDSLYYVAIMPSEHKLKNPYVDRVLANNVDGVDVVAENVVVGEKIFKNGIVKVYFTIDIDRYNDYSGKIYLKEM